MRATVNAVRSLGGASTVPDLMAKEVEVDPVFTLPADSAVFSAVLSPLYPLWKGLFPNHVSTTEQLGLAMIHVAKHGAPKRILYAQDVNGLPPK
jgi:hypothetical protein